VNALVRVFEDTGRPDSLQRPIKKIETREARVTGVRTAEGIEPFDGGLGQIA